jgi:hypothetical protein
VSKIAILRERKWHNSMQILKTTVQGGTAPHKQLLRAFYKQILRAFFENVLGVEKSSKIA